MEGPSRPKLGISSCLLGNPVRFDGGHKRSDYVTAKLANYFDFSSFCPEQAIGLPTPRQPIRLVAENSDAEVRAVHVRDYSVEHTKDLHQYAATVIKKMAGFSGYIVKKDSPSCGMERVKVYEKDNAPAERRGVGIFTAKLMLDLPGFPIEEEGRLNDPRLRENFITRVFTMFRWQELLRRGLTKKSLVEFHTRHKFLLLAHHEITYRKLGRLLADLGSVSVDVIATSYIKLLMTGLCHLANPRKHANVLMHIMGFLKDQMSADEKVELLGLIDDHRTGLVPVIVPLTLLNHFLRRYPQNYIVKQYYLEPHPRELMLRNVI
ncbi:hypothetical protein GP2143_14591 [marine gamma proteobacterium HTCC2143]|uniref:DUF1722 domain-containing protein n=1 Tax=marine gamma proteobacterium HTCC2143 TaxID=247633 RepID=A0Y8N8_9GAMM|nr:hypothetical protein GP2143_14591 [marine gamma proteobacterium HTCC2143]